MGSFAYYRVRQAVVNTKEEKQFQQKRRILAEVYRGDEKNKDIIRQIQYLGTNEDGRLGETVSTIYEGKRETGGRKVHL